MSGVTGGNRIERKDYLDTIKDYQKNVLNKFLYKGKKLVKEVKTSGSFNSKLSKQDFGDIDLIITFDNPENLSKKDFKLKFAEFIKQFPDDVIIKFKSDKYKGRKFYNSGEIISIMYPIYKKSDKYVQIDNIFSFSKEETDFKKSFLDMPAEKQGLVLGLIKTVLLEKDPEDIFKRLNIPFKKLAKNQEYDFTLSSSGLTVEITDSFDSGIKTNKKEFIKKITDWNIIIELLKEFNINNRQFEELLNDIKKKTWKNSRSLKRIAGVFKSMVSVKSGEKGTEKGNEKEKALKEVSSILNESLFDYYVLKVNKNGTV